MVVSLTTVHRGTSPDDLDTQSRSFLRNVTAPNFLGGRIKLVPLDALDVPVAEDETLASTDSYPTVTTFWNL